MSDMPPFERGEDVQRDHLRQLRARHVARLPEGASATDVRRVQGYSSMLDPVGAAGMLARRPDLFVVKDRVVHLRVKCRSCRVESLMSLEVEGEEGQGRKHVLPRIAVWVAQRWCCEECGAREEAAMSRSTVDKAVLDRVRASGLPRSMADEVSWRSMFEKGANDDETKKRIRAIQVCKEWASKPQPKHALLLHGDPGTGKSRLAATAAMARLQHSPISWVSVAVLMAQLDAAWNDEERHKALRVMTGKGPVVLDDIDKIPTNSSRTIMHLFTAIDRREQNKQMAVIFTANGKPSDLSAKLGDVLFSRITGMCHSGAGMLHFPGPDRRLELGDAEPDTPAAAAAESWGL